MDKFKFKVILEVEVDAFDASDALDLLQDIFAVGEEAGVNVTQCEYHIKKK